MLSLMEFLFLWKRYFLITYDLNRDDNDRWHSNLYFHNRKQRYKREREELVCLYFKEYIREDEENRTRHPMHCSTSTRYGPFHFSRMFIGAMRRYIVNEIPNHQATLLKIAGDNLEKFKDGTVIIEDHNKNKNNLLIEKEKKQEEKKVDSDNDEFDTLADLFQE